MKTKTILIGAFLLAMAAMPLISHVADQPFYIDIFTRILIFAVAALSLDLILGYGGMVSFGHAAYLGVGAYTMGILSYHGVGDGFVHFGAAILVCAFMALFIGLVSLRTTGIHFIMITLAFAQMVYFLAISIDTYGGDDGMNIWQSSQFFGVADFGQPLQLYYACFALLIFVLWLFNRLVKSRFGRVLRGAKSNERRMIALGFPVLRYKLASFVLAGMLCGMAGALLANQLLFVSPATMHWTRSGEIMIMVILGGMGTLFGPVIGATAYLLLEHFLSGLTEHWQAVMGIMLILIILFAKRGIFGLFEKSPPKRRKRWRSGPLQTLLQRDTKLRVAKNV
ncbi:branched-chain amino acid ABC transporter permease [Pusillimonas noertemannii]|uniref:Amino acid/amide ABC transporter membrane protein 2 (HAAT family) n=1 Tax=Pusillimonas noertemannii TaxID=305977 RepID=A0A2U1CH10_9BURK|nr:branched-chain amino acid ABC transporter permease [Pusillimonas noertemannii]NYT68215.1 branched-chain amino acid ABC transporter permease [Pusillimonas noertemannii]PVY60185.1 amino acid/amide ABC transporter membrane protein 2 (HAAT family) [Pusillimonas noertemannii]TFL10296.1 branched-chain amino acid ABC transporter permease [Pusillimonas noertemannii]